MDAVAAEVLAVVQGKGLGLDQRLGEGLRFGWCLWRRLGFVLRLVGLLRVRFREGLDESLRFELALGGLAEGFGICRWGLDVGRRLGLWWLLGAGFRKGWRRLLLAARHVGHCPG